MSLFHAAFLFLLSMCVSLDAAYVLRNGKLINAKDVASKSVEEHYNLGIEALQKNEWDEAVQQLRIVIINFPTSTWAKESGYFLAVAYFHNGDKDLANRYLSEYLTENANPRYFEESFRYKLAIADAFKDGEKRHLFGLENLPQWMPDQDLAIALYDEVTNSLPYHELAASALLSKAELLQDQDYFRESIDCLTQAIRKFPRSTFASKAYTAIANVYLDQAKRDAHNPDILPLAQISLKKFRQDFPRDPLLLDAEEKLNEMKEIFAAALYETGQLYERKKQPKASVLYYHNAISQFPDTKVASNCKKRLAQLQDYVDEMHLSSY